MLRSAELKISHSRASLPVLSRVALQFFKGKNCIMAINNNNEPLKDLSESDKIIFEEAESLYHDKEFKKALEKFQSIEHKDKTVCFMIATLYNQLKLYSEAEKYYLLAIRKGHVGAMNNLAVLYKNEFKSYEKAQKCYYMAFQKGYVSAMFNLARLYQNELNSYEKAKACYLIAIQKGHVGAMLNLALLYHKELNSHKEAEKYYRMAAERGDAKAMRNLALLYEERKDHDKAEKYYLMAVEKGDVKAIRNLALLYHREFKMFDKAEEYYLMAIKKGHVNAMPNLALLYEEEEIRSYDKAEKYYLMAIDKGHVGAMFNLALLYHREFRVLEKAEKYYLKAVEKEHVGAMFNLALLYEEDEIKNYVKAEKYYMMASEKGATDAMNNLAWLYFSQKREKAKAIEYAQKACATEKDFSHQHTLAQILLWDNQVENAVQLFSEIIEASNSMEQYYADIQNFLLLLIAKTQYRVALHFFQSKTLRFMETYKPIYYTLMFFMQKEFPNEFRQMDSDLKTTVDDILKVVSQLRKDYA